MRKSPKETKRNTVDDASKSQRKRDMLALQALGEALVRLPQKELEDIPLPKALRGAIEEARRLSKRGALRRQRQYIGKLMRSVEVAPIREALEARRVKQQMQARQFHQAEFWRDRLVRDGEGALSELLDAYPGADREYLRQLLAETRRDVPSGDVSSGSKKVLFRYLRDLTET